MILLSVENLFSHNAEHGTLNMELFKLSNPSNLSINADMSSTMSGCSSTKVIPVAEGSYPTTRNAEH